MFKKVLTTVMCCAVLLSVASVSFSADEQSISCTLTAEPTYTVTIPASVTMGNDGTTVDVVAEDIKNLPEDKKISVTIEGTDYYKDQMVLECNTTSPRTSIRYQIINENGETIQTNYSTGETCVGKEVVSFTEDGTKQYQILPVMEGRFDYGVNYTGSITFGIAVADVV